MKRDRPDYRVTFAVLAAGVGAYSLLQSLVTPVLGAMAVSLHTNQTVVTWVLTAYLLSASISTPLLGRLGDIAGKDKMFVAALGALSVGSIVAALADNIQLMIFGRAIQGIGGGVLPLAFSIVRDEFPEHKVPGAVGTISALVAVGGLGVVLAGPIVDVLNFHWLFWIPAILTTLTAIAAHLSLPRSPVRTQGKIPWAPAVLLSSWLVALLIALSEASAWGWRSPRVLGLGAVAAVLAGWWIRIERRSSNPFIDMGMMRLPTIRTANLVALLTGVGIYAVFAFLPQLLETPVKSGYGFGASISASGLVLLPFAIAMFLICIGAGGLISKFDSKPVILFGSLIATASLILCASFHHAEWQLYVAMTLLGAGFGAALAGMSSLVVGAVPPAQTGVASGMNANIRTIGGSLGAAVMASLVASGRGRYGFPLESGYTRGFLVLAAALLLAGAAAAMIPARALRVSERARLTRLSAICEEQ